MTTTQQETWADAMATGEQSLVRADWHGAYAAFQDAHDLGHAVKRQHLAAHRGMIRAASSARRYDRVVKNGVLMTAALLFDRGDR